MNNKSKKKREYYHKNKSANKKEVKLPVKNLSPQNVPNQISSDSEDEAPDFNYLLKLPPSTGSHFLLKSEQEKFTQELTSTEFSKYFNLDTKILNLCLMSIPFYERHDNVKIEWTSEEKNRMKNEAKVNEELYRDAMESNIFDTVNNQKTDIEIKLENLELSKKPPKNSSENENATSSTKADEKDQNSIQKWLDDILDI
ncbi:CLUMA_CG019063, isoform A [Clunio marinus]|uniref:CLUMA_CG019063, isoform A n=1 Tax=Clunio marinus TaxID=568069 RepID=A0A1J1J1F3_9DIPT|nr:CLUMA_CG019063, isoform A [Clunio marinus]